MINHSKKFFFRTVLVILEDSRIAEIIKDAKYSSIIIVSHSDLDLPHFSKRVKTTALINLKLAEDEIFRKFNETTRNEINKTYKIADFEVVKDGNFKEAYALYKDFEYAQGRMPFGPKHLEKCLLFSVYYKKKIISGIFVDSGEKDLRVRYIFSKRLKTEDKEMYRTIAYATRRLMWEICQYGKKQELDSLDLASVNFKNPAVANITKFKMSFGGDVVNEYTYTYKSTIFSFFEKAVAIKLFFKRFFR